MPGPDAKPRVTACPQPSASAARTSSATRSRGSVRSASSPSTTTVVAPTASGTQRIGLTEKTRSVTAKPTSSSPIQVMA